MNFLRYGLAASICAMTFSAAADELKTIGAMKPMEAAMKLEQLGLKKESAQLKAQAKLSSDNGNLSTLAFWNKKIQPWQHTHHAVGYVAPVTDVSETARALVDATNISPEPALKDQAVKITLDRLRVFAYPGGGVHNIMFDFYGQHQAGNAAEDVHFSQVYRAQEGEGAGVAGYPIFVGLKLAKEGLKMRARTVNVKNDDDEQLLAFMGSETFKNGLQLINTTNPLTPVVTKFATGLFEMVGKRNQNVAVQDIDLGLDFSSISTRPKLAQGSYVAVQTPDQTWDWSKWKFYPSTGQILSVT